MEEQIEKKECACFYCSKANGCPHAWDDHNMRDVTLTLLHKLKNSQHKELQVISLWLQFGLNQLK